MRNFSAIQSFEDTWNWDELCGPDGFQLWSPKTHDLGMCFQQLCLQMPVLSILAIISAYYSGMQINHVSRGQYHRYAINFRCLVAFLFALMPVLHTYSALESGDNLYAIHYMLPGVQSLAWLTHLLYNVALKKRLTLSARGPVFICVLWTMLAVLAVISLRSNILINSKIIDHEHIQSVNYAFSIVYVILHICYGLSLIPNQGSTVYVQYEPFGPSNDETQGLLTSGVSAAFSRFSEDLDPNYLGVAMEDCTWLSKLLFYWVNPLMEKGAVGKINQADDDLYDLPDSLNSVNLGQKLDAALVSNVPRRILNFYDQTSHSGLTPSTSRPDVSLVRVEKTSVLLIRALHKCFWFNFYGIGVLKLISDCSNFAGPMLLNLLVSFIEDKGEDIRLGYLYALGLFLTTVISAFCNTQFSFQMSLVGLRMRASIITTIYKKTLSVSSTSLNSAFSMGEIVNFMSTDTDRVVNSCPSFHSLWSIPFQLGVTLYLLYRQVGLAFLTGVAFSIILIPINKVIANKIGDLSAKMMERKDNRVKMMAELLRGIKSVKLHVWEGHFIKVITKIRDQELKYLKGRKYLDALCVYFWATTPVLISILTFTTYVLMGNKLTAATVFTTIALLNMLISPLNAFPWVLNGITEAWVSIKRIQGLLDLPDLQLETYYNQSTIDDNDTALVMRDSAFSWNKQLSPEERRELHSASRIKKDKGKGKKSKTSESSVSPEEGTSALGDFNLNDINLTVKKGEFVGILGEVGAGKSSILNAIMAELTKQSGQIAVAELERGFGYASQQPWLQRGTIRDNVLFGRNYDETKYVSVLQACGLMEDLSELPAGDLTGVGEGGMTLSGGQRARIALARAVYQDMPIYLFDDIISAVDRKVAKHILKHCIGGLLKNKTVILCTHDMHCLAGADRVLFIKNGTVENEGSLIDVLGSIFDRLPIDIDLDDSHAASNALGTISDLHPIDLALDDSLQSSVSLMSSIKTQPRSDEDSILNEETHETGSVRASVYACYWKSIGHLLSLAIIISLILMQTSRNMSDWWLSYWVSAAAANSTQINVEIYLSNASDNSVTQYLRIYCALGAANSLFTLFRAFLFAYGGIEAASKVHKALLRSIISSKITFFDISPLGRILNRFSSDTYTVDDSLPFILNILLAQFFGLLGAVVITLYGLPWLSLVLVPLIPVYSWLQNHYRLTSRELKRLSSVTLSPVYSHFNESLQGLTTIRAFRTMRRFKDSNAANVDVNQKVQFASAAVSQWLNLRLQFIGVAMVSGVGVLAVIQHQFDVANPGLVGLAISYALSVTSLLSGVVNAFTESEREMIAVERVNQYITQVPPEKNNFIIDPPYAWPTQGVVSFNDVILKYRDHLIPSLKGVSFETRPAEKIGVVGRTGAGKSSLIVSLFRLVELHKGAITVDSVNISHISITALRSRLSCIPQEPFLFSGTIRENLDPLGEFRDGEIWSALTRVDLTPIVKRLGGLEQPITNGGQNLSAGQRQLFCLARALLHNAKILCIDEATSNINQSTDWKIQQTLRSAFKTSTVIIIAHRIETVLDCDRVLVMSDGQVVEFDRPDLLLTNTNSYFYKLANND